VATLPYTVVMQPRLIAVDIDGTLLDSGHQVPAENAQAVCAAVAAGIEVALVTGRRYHFALPIAEQIPCDLTMILNNGALVKSKSGQPLVSHLLAARVARQVLEATREYRPCAAVMFDRPRENQVLFERLIWDDPIRKGYLERNREYIGECDPLESCLSEDPIQVMFSGAVSTMGEVETLLRGLPFASQFSLAITAYPARNFSLVDVLVPGCSKGAALAEWAARRRLKRSEVMAIGDNLNDLEMLEFAGLPVVMGNSVPELKRDGWRVTLSNDACGVAAAIREFALNGTG